ncbi:MAG: TolC family protein, partial [Pararheinheimera sp.]|nr:TolC family protein [Rheinheimera sp.]
GNFSKLDYLREQGQLSDATLNLVMAQQAVYSSTEQLNRLLGLWNSSQTVQLPERLPELPTEVRQIDEFEANALEQRLDVKLAKMKLQMIANNAGLTKATRFINAFDLDVGGNTKDSSERSYSASLELPIFDWGNYRARKVEAEYWQAFNEAAATGVNARSEIRENYLLYRSTYDVAAHYKNTVLPIQQQIAEENQLRYNGMFISVFELIADARTQISAVTGYVNATKDFWVAKSQLDLALIGTPAVVDNTDQTKAAANAESADH